MENNLKMILFLSLLLTSVVPTDYPFGNMTVAID